MAATIREAAKCRERRTEGDILNLIGHGLTDMTAYDQYLNGDLIDCPLFDDDIKKNINALDSIG